MDDKISIREYAAIFVPVFFVYSSVHLENIFSTLVFYKAVCVQQLPSPLHQHCDDLEAFPAEEDKVQSESAVWTSLFTVFTAVPGMIACVIVSKWSH